MKGKIIINGYYESDSEKYRCRRLIEEFQNYPDIDIDVYRNNLCYSLDKKVDWDFALFFDKDYPFCKFLESQGVKTFNTSSVLENTDNKILTSVALQGVVEMPETIPVPKKFFPQTDANFIERVEGRLGYPFVLKEAYGSLGKQVYLIENREQFLQTEEKVGIKEHLYQYFETSSFGQSIRVIVIGGKAEGAMKLTSKGDFRSNAHLGGTPEVFPLTEEYRDVAEKVAKSLGADYCGVDFFVHKPMVIEVNGSAYFSEFERKTGINVARKIVRHIYSKLI